MKRTTYVVSKKRNLLPALLLVCLPFATLPPAFAQKANAGDQIQLPEVTTTVSGDSLTAGRNAVPDFTVTLPDADTSTAPLPQLPTAKSDAVVEEPEAGLSYGPERTIYAEGLIGGGYPGYFDGDFSIYKSSGENPFKLQFSHVSANGYGTHSAADGFFDSTTALSGEKQITFKNTVLKLSASYDTVANGMQSLSKCFFDNTQQTISTGNSVQWNLPYGFAITLGAGGDWYSRYAGLVPGSATSYTLQDGAMDTLVLEPNVIFAWSNETAARTGVTVDFTAKYNFETFLSGTEFGAGTAASENGTAPRTTSQVNRGQFGLHASWSNAFVTLEGRSGLVVGNTVGSSDAPTFITAPFLFGVATHFNTKNAARQILISVSGGLDSYLPLYADLEKTYLFTAQQYLPSETTDWFASAKASVPVSSHFSFNLAGNFRATAFGNGVWEPDYAASSACGLYGFAQTDRIHVDSDAGFSFLWELLTVSADWKANWLYVPVNEDAYTVGLRASVESPNGFWGANAGMSEALGDGADAVPELDAGGFVRLTDSLRLALDLNDAIKLFSGTERTYAGTTYLSRAGSVTLLVKFFF